MGLGSRTRCSGQLTPRDDCWSAPRSGLAARPPWTRPAQLNIPLLDGCSNSFREGAAIGDQIKSPLVTAEQYAGGLRA